MDVVPKLPDILHTCVRRPPPLPVEARPTALATWPVNQPSQPAARQPANTGSSTIQPSPPPPTSPANRGGSASYRAKLPKSGGRDGIPDVFVHERGNMLAKSFNVKKVLFSNTLSRTRLENLAKLGDPVDPLDVASVWCSDHSSHAPWARMT